MYCLDRSILSLCERLQLVTLGSDEKPLIPLTLRGHDIWVKIEHESSKDGSKIHAALSAVVTLERMIKNPSPEENPLLVSHLSRP